MTRVSGHLTAPAGLRRRTQPSTRKVIIAIPCYGGKADMMLTESLFRLLTAAPRLDVSFDLVSVDYADIVVARNYLASLFYFHEADASHLLFLDDDMGFDPDLIADMLALNRPVVGAVYPRRTIDLKALHGAAGQPFERALAEACGFVGDPGAVSDAPFVRVRRCGTGILLIQRACLDRMLDRQPDLIDREKFRGNPALARVFDKMITPFDKIVVDGHELSEDFSFCHRWVAQCQGEIWVSQDHRIRHRGSLEVQSRYRDLKA